MTQERRYDSITVRVEVPDGSTPLQYVLSPAAMKIHDVDNVDDAGNVINSKPNLDLCGEIIEAKRVPIEVAAPETPPTNMYEVYQRWQNCKRCELHERRRQVVFGSGNDTDPKILVIGEAPGEEEDIQGIPFIGPTGQKLRRKMAQIGINPDLDCYITNSVTCFPTPDGKRIGKATGTQLLSCRHRLGEQFQLLGSLGSLRAVLLVGKYAYVQFFKREALEAGQFNEVSGFNSVKIGSVLGWYPGVTPWPDLKVMTIYHPSYLQRQKATESSPLMVDWTRDLEALKDWALNGKYWDPRPVK